MYADDTTLHCHSNRKSEIERSLNEDLNTVNKWCILNNMLINPTKTTCMLIGTAQRIVTVTNELNINLENQFIKNVDTQKLLGIYIDNNLDWKEQVDHICKNINSRLFLLSKIKKYLDKKSRILFFNSYILPIFYYCSNVWGNLNDEGIQRITKLQKRAARIILDAPFLTPTKELFENLNWLSLCDRISYNKLVLVYKIMRDKTPNYLKKLCIPSSEVHTRNLRDRPFNLKVFFLFRSEIFFRTTRELEYLFFLSRKAQFFFPEFNIRLYDKNSERRLFFFPPPKSEYFFQQHWESEYFFRKKT